MAKGSEASELLDALRQDFLPFLQKCSDPEQLPELLRRLANCLGAGGAVLWRQEEEQILPQATFGFLRADWAAHYSAECAGVIACRNGASVLVETDREPYRVDALGQRLAQVAGIPVRAARGCVGAVELAWKQNAREAAPIAQIFPELEESFAQVLPALLAYAASRQTSIKAITRLMMLYDVGKVFHSTLELGELAPLIVARVQQIVEAEAAAIWLLDTVKKNLYCAAATGPRDPSMDSTRVWASDPGLGAALSEGEPVLLHKIDDPAWTSRWGQSLLSILVVPLKFEGQFLGAFEAIRGVDGAPFTEEDLRVLVDVGRQAAVALRNAQRYQAERRVKELHALLEISKEITATLDLDRVLTVTVNRIATVIPADRCSVSVLRKGKWEISAISGEITVDQQKAGMPELAAMHEWLAGLGGDLNVKQTEEGITAEHDDIREKFAVYFEKTGYRALSELLLKDEEGAVGVLVLENKDPLALTASHHDLARIFANQVTSAIRNAMLYRQVPLIGVLQPLVEKKAKFAALPAVRQRAIVAVGLAALLFLIFFPWWSKPAGDARVLPKRVQPVSAEVEGVLRSVLVREGDRVTSGQLIAELASDEPRVALEQAQAQYDILGRRVLQLEAQGELGAARLERARWQQAAAELDLRRTQVVQTQVRSPISGVVVTPHVEERVGQDLHRGDVFCQVVNLDHAWTEIAIPEVDVGHIRPGEEAWLKLNAYPNRKFVGHVIQMAPQAREQQEERFFDVIVDVPNPDQLLRAGMMGRGKVLAQRSSVGWLILRVPARWIWLKVWKWLP